MHVVESLGVGSRHMMRRGSIGRGCVWGTCMAMCSPTVGRSVGKRLFVVFFPSSFFSSFFHVHDVFRVVVLLFPDWGSLIVAPYIAYFVPTTAPSELLIKLPGNDASLCVCLRCWPKVPWLFVAISSVGLAQAAWYGVDYLTVTDGLGTALQRPMDQTSDPFVADDGGISANSEQLCRTAAGRIGPSVQFRLGICWCAQLGWARRNHGTGCSGRVCVGMPCAVGYFVPMYWCWVGVLARVCEIEIRACWIGSARPGRGMEGSARAYDGSALFTGKVCSCYRAVNTFASTFQTEPETERSERFGSGESSCSNHLRHLGLVVGRNSTSKLIS
jgi:hypothetical protein